MWPIIIFQTGFRPFFLLSALFSVLAMLLWGMQLHGLWMPSLLLSPITWHAHEMLFGYALAVVAGFLLTAVRNWTRRKTAEGRVLQCMALFWLLARVMYLAGDARATVLAMMMDTCFLLLLVFVLTWPVVQCRQWKNLAVLLHLYVLLIAHVLYVFGSLHWLAGGERIGILLGLYMVLSLILVLARRVMPMFIERGLGGKQRLVHRKWVDYSTQPVLLLFIGCELYGAESLAAVFSMILCGLHTIRLWGWHAHGIWQKPLLWVLYLAYLWSVIGFAMKGMSLWLDMPAYLSLHAFAVGSIGMMTLGMMARVILGHTGRDIMQPPSSLPLMFAMMFTAAWVRVMLPLFFASYTDWWIIISQLLWVGSFMVFLLVYAPMLVQARVDGRPG